MTISRFVFLGKFSKYVLQTFNSEGDAGGRTNRSRTGYPSPEVFDSGDSRIIHFPISEL